MRKRALAATVAMTLAPLLFLVACPSLGEIVVGSPPDATAEDRPVPKEADGASNEADVAATCDAALSLDPKNCGRCGHDCLGGACAEGACQPVLIYSGGTPMGLVVDGPTLFVAVETTGLDTGYVFRCTASDCMATKTVLASGLDNPWFTVKEGSTVYWANFGGSDAAADPGSVTGCSENGCPEAGPVIYSPDGGGVEGGINVSGLAVDETYLYWTELFGSPGFNGGIFRCARTECAATVAELVGGFGFPFEVAVDPSYVYWIDIGQNEVLRCTLPSCSGSPDIFAHIAVAETTIGLSGLALYDGHVYWTDGVDDGGVFACPEPGCGSTPMPIARGQKAPAFVAVDDSGVYWSSTSGGTVMHCPPAGCTKPVQIASAPAPYAIAFDARSVYFTNSVENGGVLRVAK